jgi:Tol biopolymer transport system component
MKRCPECRRNYFDETLLYCLDDGTQLLEGPGTAEQPTAILSGGGEDSDAATRRFTQATADAGATRVLGSTSQPAVGSRKWIYVAAAGALVLVVAAIAYFTLRPKTAVDNTPRAIKLERVTSEGKTSAAAISPDGKYAVYNVDSGGTQSLWTRQIVTGSPVQIIAPIEGVEYSGIQFTPDGNFVTFLRRDPANTLLTLFQIPVLGGAQKKLAQDVDGAITFSPNASQFAFIRGNSPAMGESSVVVANADGSNQRIVAKRKRPETFPWWSFGNVAWSPDGKTIAAVIGGPASGSSPMQLAEISIEDGTLRTISEHSWYEIKQIDWLPDKSGVLVLGAEKATDFYAQQISLVSFPSGEFRRITSDFNNYISLDLTADGRTLAAVQSARISNIWIVPNADTNQAVQIKSGGTNQEGTDGLAWAPDGRIVYYSKARGPDDIWIMNNDGSDPKPLTIDSGTNYDLKVTPDGRYIVFTSERAGAPNIWRMDTDGGNPKQLTFGNSEYGVTVTPDSKWVLYDSTASGAPAIWKVSIDGGEPSQVITRYTENAEISPDGKYIVCQFREDAVAQWKYALFNIDGSDPVKVLEIPAERGDVRWTGDGRGLTFTKTANGVANVWMRPLDGGPDKQITNFKTDVIFNFKWSPDGRSIVTARGSLLSDLVLIRDFR